MFDITSMLGSSQSGSNDSMGSFNFADYAALKNGSYGKLVKSYYSGTTKAVEAEKAQTAKAANAVTRKKEIAAPETSALTQIKKDADQLKTAANALDKDDLWKKTDGRVDTDKITSAVKDFASAYNKVIDQASKANTKEIAQDTKFMTQMTDTFSKVLGKIGISVGADGKMTVDEDALKKADTATVRSLFDGNGTYGSQIAGKAESIYRDADISASVYNSNATATSALSGIYNQFI